MNDRQINKPLKLNMDKNPKALGPEEMYYALNHEIFLNKNGDKRGTLGKGTPFVANRLACEMDMPAGENYAPNTYYSQLTNELYSWVYNHNGVHFIQRINGDGDCEIVYHGCLNLSASPKHQITQWRAYLHVEKLCANRHGKSLIFVDGNNEDIHMIDVDASIATENFTTPFFERCGDACDLIKMCIPDPCGCLKAEFVPFNLADAGKSNHILDTGFKFAFRHVAYDNRASIYADPSTLIYFDTKRCFDTSEGFPRCIKLRVPIGDPRIDKIEIVYWKNGLWYLYDTVDKYKKYNSTQQFWYERELAELTNYSDDDCSFDYYFCNDKQCEALPPDAFTRVYNPMPRQPQGFFPIGLSNQKDTALAFYNYKQGNCPIDKFELDKFDIQVNCPEQQSCATEFTTVTAYAVVHNREHHTNQPIFRLGGTAANTPDDDSDVAYFGGLNQISSGGLELGFGQEFREKTRNFIAYAEGTDNWDEMKQWKADPGFTNKEEWGTIAHFNDDFEKRRWRRAIKDGQYFYQKIELKVPKGTRGFLRLASHESTGNDQDKSTNVAGIFNDITAYRGSTLLHSGNTDFTTKEIYFDTCGLDTLEILKAFVIEDHAVDAGVTERASAYSGYLKDFNDKPVEGAVLSGIGVLEVLTDHNGFFHFHRYPGTNDTVDITVKVEQDCSSFSTIQTASITGEKGVSTRHDIKIDNEAWADAFYATINAVAKDCDGNGISGLRVALSGSKYKTTGSNGIAVFEIRNYQSRNRTAHAVLLDIGGCFEVDCNGNCNPCMPTAADSTPACYISEPQITLSEFTINVESATLNTNGLKAGGSYPFGIVAKGKCGRVSAVYPVRSIDIPRTQEKGALTFCGFTFNGNNITLPSWVDCLDIVRGENLNQFELQWVVDKIERTGDGKIKLTIQSLNDYNEQYFFQTNTIYRWLKDDRVEFIRNGDGKILSIAQNGLLNYLTLSPAHDELVSGETEAPADFFNQLLITDDGKLDDLEEGALIELQRPRVCTTEPAYYGICVSIPVNDGGKLAIDSGVFHTFDTYFVNRKIGPFPVQRFEHHNPSDFWGDQINRLTDTGKGYFVNKYENEQRLGRNITLNNPGEYNRFGDIVKRFDPSVHGDIIAIGITDNKIGLCISEHDNSLFEVGDDLLRVGNDGIVRAVTSDQVISDSQPKLRGAFGCQYGSIGSILFDDGLVTWIDMNRHSLIKHDYREAKAMDIGKCQRYFRRRCQEIETFNRAQADPLDQFRFAIGKNYQSGAVYLTIKALRHSGIMNEAAPFLKPNETISFHLESEDFLGFVSFTPEGYGRLDLFDDSGCAFISYLNGIPYIHPIIPSKWNEFYGVACDWIVGIVLNKGEEKRKRPLAIEVQSDTMFFVKEVLTEKSNFKSEIPAIRWKPNGNKWNGVFLGNSLSRAGLYGDEKPTGYYAEVLFMRDNTDNLRYNTVDNNKRVQYSELDEIFFKFSVMEQSGVTANL